MQFNDLLHQVEADTRSGNPGRRPGTKIALEQPGHVFWIDPHSEGFCIIFTSGERARGHWRLVALSSAIAASFI